MRGGGRDRRPNDHPVVEVWQCDLKTGKTIRRFVPPWPGGLHGATWNDTTQTLWLGAVGINALVEVDPKDNFRIQHILPVRSSRPHGLGASHQNCAFRKGPIFDLDLTACIGRRSKDGPF